MKKLKPNKDHGSKASAQIESFSQNTLLKLIAVIQSLSLARDIDTITHIIRKAARELMGADGATFILRDGGMCHYVDEDAIGSLWKGKQFPMESCISGWVMLNKKSVVIPDIYKDARIPIDAYRPTFVKSLAMVPIRTIAPIGAIGIYWAKENQANVSQIELLQALADSTSIAIENVKLYTDLKIRLIEKTDHETQYRLLAEQLQHALDEKSLLLKEIYHRVKNNLQIVSSLLNLHADLSENKFVQDTLQNSIARINSMALVHEMLYCRDNLSNVLMPDYIKQLVRYLYNITETDSLRVKPQIDIDDIGLNLDRAIPCGLIINELISNSLKHAFPGRTAGKINISMRQQKDSIMLSVCDNGIGILSNKDQDTKTTGLGLELVKTLTKQIDGSFNIASDQGTSVTINFLNKLN